MKQLTLIFIISLLASAGFAQTKAPVKHHNHIDDICTDADVKSLLVSINPAYKSLDVKEYKDKYCKYMSDSLLAGSWVKSDFDNNGYTDLVVECYRVNDDRIEPHRLYIIDSGENHFCVKDFPRNEFLMGREYDACVFNLPIAIGPDRCLLHYVNRTNGYLNSTKTDTLIYKYGDFIERNGQPAAHRVDSVIFYVWTMRSLACMKVYSDWTAIYIQYKWAYPDTNGQKIYRTIIDVRHYNELMDLLNYLDFEKLDSSYPSGGDDGIDYHYTIGYDNGKIKRINNDNEAGTFGLHRLDALMEEIIRTQVWK